MENWKYTTDCLEVKDGECKKCIFGFNLQKGLCCPQDTYLNIHTMKCEFKVLNCSIFDYYNQ